MDTASALGSGNEGRARWSLKLLGGFELSLVPGGEKVSALGKRERVLLAYLALSPNGRQPRRKLATLLWGDATDVTALDNLRTCVWGLRKALGDAEHRLIARDGEDVVLDLTAIEVDALVFRRLAAQAGRSELETAANLCAGELLAGLDIENDEFESWRRVEATRFRDQAVDVLARLMAQLAESGETERAIAAGTRISALEPLNEAAARWLMRLYAESGRRGAAVELYRTLSDSLRAELDAQPEVETRALFAEITRGGEGRAGAAAAADTTFPTASPSSLRGEAVAHASLAPSAGAVTPVAISIESRRSVPLRAALAALAAAVLIAITLISYWEFSGSPLGVATERTAAATPAGAISIAVLPFANMSGDAAQEFFSDGMTEEITTALAKIPDLRVVARESAFQYKGEKKDLRAVGRALGATHLIEGSVRKDGDHVRVTVQLVGTNNGVNVWAETYDRQLTGVFAIQEDIATAIAGALRMPLGLRSGESLVNNRIGDPEIYDRYLRAKALIRARPGFEAVRDAANLLEGVVARNPEFAPGWAWLAYDYAYTPLYQPDMQNGSADAARGIVDASLSKAESAGRRAIQLDSGLAHAYLSLGLVQSAQGKFATAEELYSKALALDPDNPDALHSYSFMLAGIGYLKKSLVMRQHLRALEPYYLTYNIGTAEVLWLNGQNDTALAEFKALSLDFNGRGRGMAWIYATEGRYREAADALVADPAGGSASDTVQEAARLLRTAPSKAASPRVLPRLGNLEFVYAYVGAVDRVLESHEANVESGYSLAANNAVLWQPAYAAVRKTDRFKALVKKAGFVDYWRARGWPDLCHPVGTDDFACE